MTRPHFLFVHGWAGTPAIWDGLCAELAARGVEAADMLRVDLTPAYAALAATVTGAGSPLSRIGAELRISLQPSQQPAPVTPAFAGVTEEKADIDSPPGPASRPLIGIGHSLGVALLLASGLPLAGLLALNGFTRFTSAPDHAAGTPPRLLAQMRRRLLADPATVLADFQNRAGLPRSEILPGPAAALAAGLDVLSAIDARAAFGDFASPVTALCGRDDAIVPPEQSRADFPDPVFIDGASHALPTRCPALVADHLLALAARC